MKLLFLLLSIGLAGLLVGAVLVLIAERTEALIGDYSYSTIEFRYMENTGVVAHKNSSQIIPTGQSTKIDWGKTKGDVITDEGKMDLTLDRYVALRGGTRIVSATVSWDSTTAQKSFMLEIWKNSTRVFREVQRSSYTATVSGEFTSQISGLVDMKEGDFVEIFVFQDTGGNKVISGNDYSTWFSVVRV